MLALLFLLALAAFNLTRLILAIYSGVMNVPLLFWPGIFLRGVYFDLATLAYPLTAFLILRAAIPERLKAGSGYRRLSIIALGLWMGFLLTLAVFEMVYWIEFSTRFNFIALDYLIYTNEVLRNIWQSYPVIKVFSVVILAAILLARFLYKKFIQDRPRTASHLKQRLGGCAAGLLLAFLSYKIADIDDFPQASNLFADELSKNGLFTLASAARHNDLDYDRFYATIPEDKAHDILKRLEVEWSPDDQRRANDRWGNDHPDEAPPFVHKRPRNIVLISIESLSASFLGSYGSTAQLTPRMDAMAKQSLVFRNVYATGTRTVRGLEALSLAMPPIPGQAVIRRPKNTALATLGEMLAAQDFKTYFIYGGYGYFDNMNEYFQANRYEVIDRTDFPASQIAFENVWGVADESLYDNALPVFDQASKEGKRFFAHIMTTSNHRPYTYPAGRIDIPSPGGRNGAVKYTDYALGRFIESCRTKPWFKDTLFVITADHCASVAGKTDLPVAMYHIPLMLYAPGLLKPGYIDRMVSQIDIPPTLIDIFGVAGDDNFFGKEMNEQAGNPRAFVSNYQSLGYYKNDQLVILKPKKKIEAYSVNPKTYEQTPTTPDPTLVEEAIAYYQTSSRAFKLGKLRLLWH